jgi:pimeloyl-ACP methyl ester carboxylesterase
MRSNRKLRWLMFVLTLYLVVCSVGGTYLADDTLRPPRRPLTDEEVVSFQHEFTSLHASLEDVSITTPDSTVLRGWVLRPAQANGHAVLLLHGLGDNRLGMTGYAELLLAHGFTVLLPDARAHGVSGGLLATYGLIERNDIHQWADFLADRMNARCVYGMGESMGAAQLLQSLPTGSRLCAVVAESPFASFREIAYDRMGQPFNLGPWVGRTVLRPLVEVAFFRASWKYKLRMDAISPEDAVASTHIPVMLIHGQVDSNIPLRHSRLIHDRQPAAVLWEVPGADHCGAISTAPQEFETRVVGFFEHSPVLSAKRPN